MRGTEKFPQFSGENGTEIPQTLPRTHDLQVEICGDPEVREYLAHHLAMLRGRDNERLQLLGGLELLDHWGQLDGFWARSHYDSHSVLDGISMVLDFEAHWHASAAFRDLNEVIFGWQTRKTESDAVITDLMNDDPTPCSESWCE